SVGGQAADRVSALIRIPEVAIRTRSNPEQWPIAGNHEICLLAIGRELVDHWETIVGEPHVSVRSCCCAERTTPEAAVGRVISGGILRYAAAGRNAGDETRAVICQPYISIRPCSDALRASRIGQRELRHYACRRHSSHIAAHKLGE